ncbi:uncharacterized protein LOC110462724 [Mizuhopecten yessoensis]|uniref:Vamide n=1 Tax=Mizuhopecten yessoensis TaxID=6573 RepID=A0A210PXM0_MIZYE|nr:uncharacterized protein LOC110462724 [Mizuhopecten yessoensis]AXN93528.1 Vamide [Mizuhopecten yessoensis]OWF41214.1 hypothetical protein KP79_PYT21394 [Mizuhopecten yessoensis]
MNVRHRNGITNVLMSMCFLIFFYDVMALPGKQVSDGGRKHITSGDFDSLNTEEIPSELFLDINDDDGIDDLEHQYEVQQFDDPRYVTVEEPGVGKRFLGRWRNLNWKLRQRELNKDDVPVGKRFFGRWMNRNYILSKLEAERKNQVGKRFLGRWRNRNYLLEKMKDE